MRTIKGLLHTTIGVIGLIVVFVSAMAAFGCLVFLGVAPVVRYWVEADDTLPEIQTNQHTVMYDKNGSQFAEIWSEDRKEVKSINDINPIMRSSILSAEDKDFYSHGAIDVPATVRSVVSSSGGGSGITQQLIKNLLFYRNNATTAEKKTASETTISRKIRELKLALSYEKNHSKDDILLEYLNTVAIGGPNTYGIETASESIFNKSAKDLTLGEAAALAGSVNNPSLYNLTRMNDADNAKRVKTRQEYVLSRLLADGKISKKDYDQAVKDPITTNMQERTGSCSASKYPFYCQMVVDYLLKDGMLGNTADERARSVAAGGLEIKTPLDPTMIDQLEHQLKTDWGTDNTKVQATAVVQPGTGYIMAIGSNRDWGLDASKGQTQVVLPTSKTQTGSTYKMMTLAAALNAGWSEDRLNAVSSACPWTKNGFDTPVGGIRNSTSCALQGGHLSYRQATAYSANTWFVELESQIGVNAVKNFSKSVGLTVPDSITSRSASFALGVTDNSPVDMAAAYATFANKGVYCPASPIISMQRADGDAIQPPDEWNPDSTTCRSVMSPHSASIILKAQDANINGTDIPGRFGEKAAVAGHLTVGKSGTTTNYANQVWTQTVGQYVVFSNGYDPRGNFQHTMEHYRWRGYSSSPATEAVLQSTRDFISTNLQGQNNAGLDLTNTDDNWKKVASANKSMVTIPDLRGMKPSSALETLRSLGINGAVLKVKEHADQVQNNSQWPSGVIYHQSIDPGTKILIGSNKIIALSVAE
jgi:membrane peptidoglycan carboxypeptidase